MKYTLVVGPWEGYVQYIKNQDIRVFDGRDAHAPSANTVLAIDRDQIYFWFPERVKPTTSRWAGAIAHEALHATIGVLTDRGLKIATDEAEEAATYYTGWLVEKLVDLLKGR